MQMRAILLMLIVAGSNALRVHSSDTPELVQAAVHAQGAPANLPPSPHKLMIDADMDVDDMWTIALALSDPRIDVVGITVSPGWSHQWAGVPNAQRLVEAFALNPATVPVAYGTTTKTQLVATVPTNLPPGKFLGGIDHYLTKSVPLPAADRPPSSFDAHQLILQTMRGLAANETLDLVVTGSFSNLALAMNTDPGTFLSKVGTVYFSGALVEPATNKPYIEQKNFSPEDHRYGSNAFPHTDRTPGTSWNVFLDPISASQIFSSGVKIVASTWDSQNVLHISEEDPNAIPSECRGTERADFAANFTLMFAPATGQKLSHLRYWDPSTFLTATQAIFGMQDGENPICKDWKDLNLRIELEQADGTYGWVKEGPNGSPVRACMHADLQVVLPIYWKSMACGVMQK